LIALQEGVIENESEIIKWDGKETWRLLNNLIIENKENHYR
jgi:hypothetical protein